MTIPIPTEIYKMKVALTYLHWLTLPAALYWRYYVSPPGYGESSDALTFCIGVMLLQPGLTAAIRFLFLRGPFESEHGKLALTLNFWFASLSFGVVLVSILSALSYVGLLLALALFYLVLPLIVVVWWSVLTACSLLAVLGSSAEDILPQLPGVLRRHIEAKVHLPVG